MKNAIENSKLFEINEFNRNRDFIHDNWKSTDIDDWNTCIFDMGNGEPMLFVPIADSLEVYDSLLLKHFSGKNRVITFRRRENDRKTLYREDRAEDIKRILDYLNIERAHIVSHSSGSIAATTFALKHPQRVISYVWMNLSPVPAMDMAKWKRILGDMVKYIPLSDRLVSSLVAASCSGDKRNSLMYKRCLEQLNSVKESGRIKNIKKWFQRNIWSMADYRWDSKEKLDKLAMPVIVLNSDNDVVNSSRATELLEKNIRNSYGHKIIRGGYHLFQYACSDQVIRYMEEFYSSLK